MITAKMSDPYQIPLNDGLTQLLCRLPVELRLHIYRYSLPLTRHRKRRIDVAFLQDISWTAASPPLFDEVGLLVLHDCVLTFHTKLAGKDNLVENFNAALDRAFSAQAPWTLERACLMLQRIKIITRYPAFYTWENKLVQQLQCYGRDIKRLSNLKAVQISLAPEELHPGLPDPVERRPDHFPDLDGLGGRIASIHAAFPPDCRVNWRFDNAGMPAFAESSVRGSGR